MLHSKRNEKKRNHQWVKEAILLQERPVNIGLNAHKQDLENRRGLAEAPLQSRRRWEGKLGHRTEKHTRQVSIKHEKQTRKGLEEITITLKMSPIE